MKISSKIHPSGVGSLQSIQDLLEDPRLLQQPSREEWVTSLTLSSSSQEDNDIHPLFQLHKEFRRLRNQKYDNKYHPKNSATGDLISSQTS